MKSVTTRITTNTRVIKNLLTKYADTFRALKELLNNSIQADSKIININIDYTDDLQYRSGIKKISIQDDGYGVPFSEFDKKILESGLLPRTEDRALGGLDLYRSVNLCISKLSHLTT